MKRWDKFRRTPFQVGKLSVQFDDVFGDVVLRFPRVRNASAPSSVTGLKLLTAFNQRLTFRGLGPLSAGVSTILNAFHRVHFQVLYIVMQYVLRNMFNNFFDRYSIPV